MKISRKFIHLLFCLTCLSVQLRAGSDSLLSSPSLIQEDTVLSDTASAVLQDSTPLKRKQFNDASLGKLKSDTDMHYKQPPSQAESIFSRLLRWFSELLQSIFTAATNTGWGKILTYAIGIMLIVVIVMLILRVNAFKVLFAAKGVALKDGAIEENIHEMDFEQLIAEATQQRDYRKGVRLIFLYALKVLADGHLIRWEPGKTNHEYVAELQRRDLKKGLDDLSYYFDYAWYGNFQVSAEIFREAHAIFLNWKETVR